MQVVIEIPDEWQRVTNSLYLLAGAVANGTVLPKGHGRLVDGDALWNKMSCYSDDEGAGVDYLNDDVNPTIFRDSAMEIIENALTIIPAEKDGD